jgi:hypothetical protein
MHGSIDGFESYNGKRSRRGKRMFLKVPTGVSKLPDLVEADGEVLVKTGSGLSREAVENHLFGLSKKEKDRKAAKKEAKREAKATGKTKKEIRKAGRTAAQAVRSEQLVQKAATKKNPKAAARLLKHADKVKARQGKTLVGNVVRKIGKGIALTPLLPLKGVMKNALRKKGFPVPGKLEDLAESFHNNIVAKKNGYGEQHFDGLNDDHIAVDIVVKIVEWIKNAVQKRKEQKAGKEVVLDPTEEVVADQATTVIDKVVQQAGPPELPGSNSPDNPDAPEFTNEGRSEKRGMENRQFRDKDEKSLMDSPMLIMAAAAVIVGVLVLRK